VEDFVFGDIGIALGGCREEDKEEDAVAFASVLRAFALARWSMGLLAKRGA
jgi:hypothetical protein